MKTHYKCGVEVYLSIHVARQFRYDLAKLSFYLHLLEMTFLHLRQTQRAN